MAATHHRRLARRGWRCSRMAIQRASRAGSRGGGVHDEEAGEDDEEGGDEEGGDEEGGDEEGNNPLHGAGRSSWRDGHRRQTKMSDATTHPMAEFNPELHPREPAGGAAGGQFASAGGDGGSGAQHTDVRSLTAGQINT